MHWRSAVATAYLTAGLGVFAGVANAATLSVTVNPPGPGSPSAPNPQNVGFDVEHIKSGADGNPTVATTTLVTALPTDFIDELDRFGTCPASAITGATTPPSCPASALLGTGVVSAFVPAAGIAATTDKGYVYRTGPDTFKAWYHISKPVETAVAISGTVSQGPAPFGPTATWDLTPASSGSAAGGLEVRMSSYSTTWRVAGTASPPQPASKPQASTKTSKRSACLARARRLHGAKKRRAAIKRCRRKHKPGRAKGGRAHTHQASIASAATSSTFSPFASTACSGGQWGFQARLTYKDGTSETLNANVACGSGSSGASPTSPGGGPVPGAPTPPLPIPIP